MTFWNMLIVVCNRSTEIQLTWSRTDDFCLKTFDFIPYAIIINVFKIEKQFSLNDILSRSLKLWHDNLYQFNIAAVNNFDN